MSNWMSRVPERRIPSIPQGSPEPVTKITTLVLHGSRHLRPFCLSSPEEEGKKGKRGEGDFRAGTGTSISPVEAASVWLAHLTALFPGGMVVQDGADSAVNWRGCGAGSSVEAWNRGSGPALTASVLPRRVEVMFLVSTPSLPPSSPETHLVRCNATARTWPTGCTS